MTKISGEYTGDLKCRLVHEPSGSEAFTDAPADIGGSAQTFSPTDLVGAALGSCIVTTLGLYGKRKQLDLNGMRFEIKKEMMAAPERRIGRLLVDVWMPNKLDAEGRANCERVAHSCPVHKSLHPGIEARIILHWPHEV